MDFRASSVSVGEMDEALLAMLGERDRHGEEGGELPAAGEGTRE